MDFSASLVFLGVYVPTKLPRLKKRGRAFAIGIPWIVKEMVISQLPAITIVKLLLVVIAGILYTLSSFPNRFLILWAVYLF